MHPLHWLLASPFIVAMLLIFWPHRFRSALLPIAITSAIAIAIGTILNLIYAPQIFITNSIDWFVIPGSSAIVRFQLFSDAFSAWLLMLTGVLQISALWVSYRQENERFRSMAISFFLLQGALFGSFLATDAIIFFLFFEALIPPTMMLIANFGGPNRSRASILFGAYTLLGSLPMAGALWAIASWTGTTDSVALTNLIQEIDPEKAKWLFWAFVLAFAVKTPLFPFHSWQSESYSEAPAGLTAILSGVMAKVGVFGFLRWTIPLFPSQAAENAKIIAVFAIITVLYGALMALRQKDIKKILVYSSLSHLGLAVMGAFSFHQSAVAGVVAMMVAHGFSAGALFLLSAYPEQTFKTRNLASFGGLASKAPGFSVLFVIAILASVAIPGTLGFIGEFLILQGIWMRMGVELALLAGLGAILSAAYSLRLVQKLIFGKSTCDTAMPPLKFADIFAIVPLIVALFVLGFHPAPVLKVVDGPTSELDEAQASAHLENK